MTEPCDGLLVYRVKVLYLSERLAQSLKSAMDAVNLDLVVAQDVAKVALA